MPTKNKPPDPVRRNQTMVDLNERNFANGPLAYQSTPPAWSHDQIQALMEQEQMFNLTSVAEEETKILSSYPPVGRNGSASGTLISKRNQDGIAGRGGVAVRGRRPKNVKTSPRKRSSNSLLRRPVTSANSPQSTNDPSSVNGDECSACKTSGQIICCDGCPRSFHFACAEPPLPSSREAPEHWFCRACQTAKTKPLRPAGADGMFGKLIMKAMVDSPKVYELPDDIITTFRNVSREGDGTYLEPSRRKAVKLRGGFVDERDPYQLKDPKSGRPALCHLCKQSASQQKKHQIIQCDHCPEYWHLDCLNPPMTDFPAQRARWMCPLHAEQEAQTNKRVLRNALVKSIHKRGQPNNGQIDIIPTYRPPVPKPEEEVYLKTRYQIPEDTIILDFWDRIGKEVTAPQFHALDFPSSKPNFVGGSSNQQAKGKQTDQDQESVLTVSHHDGRHYDQIEPFDMLISATLQTEVPNSPERDALSFIPTLSPETSLSSKDLPLRTPPQKTNQLTFVPSIKIESPPSNCNSVTLSKEDMKNLMKVRKLLKPALRDDPIKAKMLMDFLQLDNPSRMPNIVSGTQRLDQN